MAATVDAGYPANTDLRLEGGRPVLARRKGAERRPSAIALEGAVLDRLPDRSLLDILARTAHLTGWHRHFGPASGSDPKIRGDKLGRYVVTTFAYGGNLGPTEVARHMRGVSAHEIYTAGNKHADGDRIHRASGDVINAFAALDVARMWGDGSVAAVDGSQIETWENNILAETSIRYGGFGGIAFRLVSDTYIALFSHFIPCGVWEAVYLLDSLLANDSDIQPDQVHADTQGQSLPVFGRGAARVRPAPQDPELARPELLPAHGRHDVQTHRLAVRRQRHRLEADGEALAGPATDGDLDPGGPTVLGDAAAPPGQPLPAQSAV